MDVVIHTMPTCPDCCALWCWLEASGIPYEGRDLTDRAIMEEAKAWTGMCVVPITVVGDAFIVGTFADMRQKIAAALGLIAEAAEKGAGS